MAGTKTVRRNNKAAAERAQRLAALPALVKSWYATKRTAAQMATLAKEGSDEIKSIMESCVEPTEDGHSYYALPAGLSKVATLKRQQSVSTPLDSGTAENILRDEDLWDEATKEIRVIDPDKIWALYYSKKITKVQTDLMFPKKVSYSLVLLDEEGKQIS